MGIQSQGPWLVPRQHKTGRYAHLLLYSRSCKPLTCRGPVTASPLAFTSAATRTVPLLQPSSKYGSCWNVVMQRTCNNTTALVSESLCALPGCWPHRHMCGCSSCQLEACRTPGASARRQLVQHDMLSERKCQSTPIAHLIIWDFKGAKGPTGFSICICCQSLKAEQLQAPRLQDRSGNRC
jgi:hypothetical protein